MDPAAGSPGHVHGLGFGPADATVAGLPLPPGPPPHRHAPPPGAAPAVAPLAPGSASASTAGSVTGGTDPGDAPRPIKRRAPVACRRCRRMRSKCIHDRAQPPCKACREAGLGLEACEFPARGQPDNDREYRHPRTRADRSTKSGAAKARRSVLEGPGPRLHAADDWDDLPRLQDLIDGVDRFTRYYFQLGFVPKHQFPDRLRNDHRSVNLFLLMSILSISARLSPSLKARYGTGVKAAEFFMDRAAGIAIGEVYQEPTLERCQAFYLLSIAQQGSALRNKSYINMGIAMRMAALMQLHREETYQVQNPNPELIMRAESARRTLWMLHSQDSLHSGPMSPVSLAAADITALLPCNEEDFACGREPKSRAALEGTPPALENPSLIRDPNRSLFATLMQIHHFWGTVSRRAVSYSRSSRPWEATSEFSTMARRLHDWERSLPHEHVWSHFLLKGYKAEGQDLAYLCVTMMTRLCNIVLRRPYLIDAIKPDPENAEKQAFFAELSKELFRNVRQLYEQIDAQFTDRTPDESVGAQIAAFCVYSCGLFSTYMCKYPNLCQDDAPARDGPGILQRVITILRECKEVWPLAARWVDALEKFSLDPQSDTLAQEGSMDDGKDPVPRAIRQMPTLPTAPTSPRRPTPTLPNNAVLPMPGSQLDMAPTALQALQAPHSGMTSAVPLAVNGQSLTPPNHQQYQTPHLPQLGQGGLPQQADFQQRQTMHSPDHQHPATHQMYMPPHQTAPQLDRQPVDGLGMLIEAFDTHQPGSAQYDMAVTAAANSAPYYPLLGPGTDGFEGELQFYMDGPPSTWLNAGAWLDTMQ